MRPLCIATIAALSLLLAGAATAEVISYTARLKGAAETPPNASTGAGSASVTLDTSSKRLSWTVEYSGLTGPATMAHFHGPAAVGKAAGIQVPLPDVASPAKGTATLTDRQIAELKAGKWYINVHTAQYPAGEIRGQVTPAK
jgi:hypothetical protein